MLSTIGLVVAILGMATVPAFAGISHQACTAKQHDCGKTPTLTTCCCGDGQSSQTDSTPVQSRVEVRADLWSMPPLTSADHVVSSLIALAAVHTSPPHRYLIDLPTLFSSFLI